MRFQPAFLCFALGLYLAGVSAVNAQQPAALVIEGGPSSTVMEARRFEPGGRIVVPGDRHEKGHFPGRAAGRRSAEGNRACDGACG